MVRKFSILNINFLLENTDWKKRRDEKSRNSVLIVKSILTMKWTINRPFELIFTMHLDMKKKTFLRMLFYSYIFRYETVTLVISYTVNTTNINSEIIIFAVRHAQVSPRLRLVMTRARGQVALIWRHAVRTTEVQRYFDLDIMDFWSCQI